MALFEWTLVLLLGAVILTGLARRVAVPYPSLLALAGAALAFVPAGRELETLAGETSPAAIAVRESYVAAREVAASLEAPQGATEHDRLRLRAISAQRRTLLRLRAEGAIGDEAFHRLEEELDWAELDAAPAGFFQPLLTDG